MNDKELVIEIRKCLESEMETYQELFENTQMETVLNDEYWKDALTLYHKFDETEKKVFFKILRQISVEKISSFFSILDGQSWLDGQEEDFNLTLGKDNQKLNGDLCDIFLEIEEE